MTLPITGPFNKLSYLNGPPNMYGFKPRVMEEGRVWYRQKSPYSLPLSFDYYLRRVLRYSKYHSAFGQDMAYYQDIASIPTLQPAIPALYNRCYEKFKGKVAEEAQLGVMFAEMKQATVMIEKRLLQLYRFSKYLRQLRFKEAANTVGVALSSSKARRMESRTRKGVKSFADNYLEFHFGWSPLVGDLFSAAEVLSKPLLSKLVSAKVTDVIRVPLTTTGDTGVDKWRHASLDETQQTITLRAWLGVVNPNEDLVNRLGLTNPVTIAWELVPFSFVLDWFVDFSGFLSSLTDFAGLNVENPHRTIFTRWRSSVVKHTDLNYNSPIWMGPPSYFPFHRATTDESYQYTGVWCHRIMGLPGPSLVIRSPWTLSARRGLAAASLLIQTMR